MEFLFLFLFIITSRTCLEVDKNAQINLDFKTWNIENEIPENIDLGLQQTAMLHQYAILEI